MDGLYFMHTSHYLTAFLTSSEIPDQKTVSRALLLSGPHEDPLDTLL